MAIAAVIMYGKVIIMQGKGRSWREAIVYLLLRCALVRNKKKEEAEMQVGTVFILPQK